MPGAIFSGTGTRCLTAFSVVLRLPPERSLIDPPRLGARERHPHMLKLVNNFRAHTTHVLDRILITNVIRTLNRVVHVPAPIVVGIVTSNRAGNSTLRRDCVRTRRKYFGNNCGFQSRLGQLKTRAHTGTATPNDNAIERKRAQSHHPRLQMIELPKPRYISNNATTNA